MKLANLHIKIWEYETGILQAKFTCDQRCRDPTENICKPIQQYIKTFDDQSWSYQIQDQLNKEINIINHIKKLKEKKYGSLHKYTKSTQYIQHSLMIKKQ